MKITSVIAALGVFVSTAVFAGPMVPRSAKIVAGANLPGPGTLNTCVADLETKLDKTCAMMNFDTSVFTEEIFPTMRKFLSDSGLGAADLSWMMVTCDGDFDMKTTKSAIAIGGKNDFETLMEKTVKTIEKAVPFSVSSTKFMLGGAQCWSVSPEGSKQALMFASVGDVMIIAMNRLSLRELIKLYSTGGKPHSAFADDFIPQDSYCRVCVIDPAAIFAMNKTDFSSFVRRELPFLGEDFAELKAIEFDWKRSSNVTLKLTFDSPSQAKSVSRELMVNIAKVQKTIVPEFVKELESDKPELTEITDWIYDFFDSIEVASDNSSVVISGDVGAFHPSDYVGMSLLMSVNTLPRASAKANGNEAALKGRSLFTAITYANTEREADGLPSLWPHEAEDLSEEDSEDIAGRHFDTSTEYFNELFDLGNSGKYPYVDSTLLSAVTLSGQTPRNALQFKSENVGWIVVSGLDEALLPSSFPVLISANVDVSNLPTEGECNIASGEKVIIDYTSKLDKRNVVVVRKNGKCDVFSADKLSLRKFFGDISYFDFGGAKIRYLKP